MNIFLQGPSGIGKSTILREALAPFIAITAGFAVQRLTEESGETAFRAVCFEGSFPPLEAAYRPGLNGVFVAPGRKLNVTALEEVILQVGQQTQQHSHKLILLDEIGGVELASPIFAGALERLLSCGKPCFGVFKSRENFERTTRNLSLPTGYAELHRQFEAMILSDGEIVTLTEQNRTETLARLKEAVAGVVAGRSD